MDEWFKKLPPDITVIIQPNRPGPQSRRREPEVMSSFSYPVCRKFPDVLFLSSHERFFTLFETDTKSKFRPARRTVP